MGRKRIIEKHYMEDYEKLIHDELATVKDQAYDGLIDFT